MMESKKYNIIFLALLLLACVKENFTVILGESITASAEIPEDSEDLEFIWELTSVPDKSEIKKSDIQFGDDSTLINFTPDVPGIYSLEVSIFLYQDEISTESFSYDVVETEIADVNTQEFEEKTYLNEGESTAVSELLVENDDSKWYDSESVADVLENIKEIKPSSRRYPAIIFDRDREAGDQIFNKQSGFLSSKPLRTSNNMHAIEVVPQIIAEYLTATRSIHPHLRGRPVVVPYSFPRSRMHSPISPSSSVGNGPAPTLVL